MTGLPFTPYEGQEPYIFVSYAHRNKDKVYPIIKRLHEMGYRVWYDEGIDPGTEFPAVIAKHLAGAAQVLTMLSPEAAQSDWVRRELTFTQAKRIKMIGVMLCEMQLSDDLELQLSNIQQIFYSGYEGREAVFYERLAKGMLEETKRMASESAPTALPQVGEFADGKWTNLYHFGDWDWLVLDVDRQNNRVLLITKDSIDQKVYNKNHEDTSWAECSLHDYLNGEFRRKFKDEEWAKLHEGEIKNPANPWFSTEGGRTTKDKVFLLSIGEAVKYFGDSGDLAARKGWNRKNGRFELRDGKFNYINDQYNDSRAAKSNLDGVWWLRSPGVFESHTVYVLSDGTVNLSGRSVSDVGGVRPALWLNL